MKGFDTQVAFEVVELGSRRQIRLSSNRPRNEAETMLLARDEDLLVEGESNSQGIGLDTAFRR